MMWLEMSNYPGHGGEGWDFGKCLWSPSRTTINRKWAFWTTLLSVKQGNTILHLRGKAKDATFVGFSTASHDGYETTERPPSPGKWAHATRFFRVPLMEFTTFSTPISLDSVFVENERALRDYYQYNRGLPSEQKRHLFYVIQANRLQCLNGAYLSEVDNELATLIFGQQFTPNSYFSDEAIEVSTTEAIRELRTRIGQREFSEKVRQNYGNQCCFPDCPVSDTKFLVGAHIARWADAPELRGQVSNGLCFCLMHDKAFEAGYFTIDENFSIIVNPKVINNSPWGKTHILGYQGHKIRLGSVTPSEEALLHHWLRNGF